MPVVLASKFSLYSLKRLNTALRNSMAMGKGYVKVDSHLTIQVPLMVSHNRCTVSVKQWKNIPEMSTHSWSNWSTRITIIPDIIFTQTLGEGDFINEALVATIIQNIFPFMLPIETIYRVHFPSICTHLFSFDYWVLWLWGSIVEFI